MYSVAATKKKKSKRRGRDQWKYDQILQADSDEVDLESLLQIVNDISDMLDEEEQNEKNATSKRSRSKLNKTCIDTAVSRYVENSFRSDSELSPRRPGTNASISSNRRTSSCRTPRTFRGSEQLILPAGRKNMSFSNESVRQIDLENKRLLRQIVDKRSPKVPIKEKKDIISRPSSSSINRFRRQREIEKDNLKFLQRLQSVKPTKSISRDYLLADHQRIKERSYRKPNIRRQCKSECKKTTDTKDTGRYSMNDFHGDENDGSDGGSGGNESPVSDKSVRSNTSSSSTKSGRSSAPSSESPRSLTPSK